LKPSRKDVFGGEIVYRPEVASEDFGSPILDISVLDVN
jgi:hypothetical protein